MDNIVELLAFKHNLLEQESALNAKLDISDALTALSDLTTGHPNVSLSVNHITSNFINLQEIVREKNLNFANEFRKMISTIEDRIDVMGLALSVGKTFELRAEDVVVDPPEPIVFKITQYCSWQYPGLLIAPKSKNWIDPMVACDPLYLLDLTNSPDIETMTAEYPTEYQRRLRIYKNQNFSLLPHNQFGFVLGWGITTTQPIDQLEKYLTSVIALLRPGGTFMFNYNNCDHSEPAALCENGVICYSNPRLIRRACEKIGYEIIQFGEYLNEDPSLKYTHQSWVEIKKPGKLDTIKRSQVIGRLYWK